MANADLTQESMTATKYGTGVVITDLYGKYEISTLIKLIIIWVGLITSLLPYFWNERILI